METIRVKEIDGVYSCDIGISKETWLELLKDTNMPDGYRDALLRFYYYPAHRGTCTAVSNMMGGNAQKLNANIRELGDGDFDLAPHVFGLSRCAGAKTCQKGTRELLNGSFVLNW